jgi:hypothetical protein
VINTLQAVLNRSWAGGVPPRSVPPRPSSRAPIALDDRRLERLPARFGILDLPRRPWYVSLLVAIGVNESGCREILGSCEGAKGDKFRGRQPYSIVRKIPYLIYCAVPTCTCTRRVHSVEGFEGMRDDEANRIVTSLKIKEARPQTAKDSSLLRGHQLFRPTRTSCRK